MMLRNIISLALLGTWLCLSSESLAAVIQYNDRTSFNSASMGLTTIPFTGLAPANLFTQYSTAAGLTQSGVNFVGTQVGSMPTTYQLFAIDPGFNGNYDLGTGTILAGGGFAASRTAIDITLPANTTAVGSDFASLLFNSGLGTVTRNAATIEVVLSTGDTFMVNALANNPAAFVGFTSDVAITAIRFSPNANSNVPVLDNFTFGQAMPSNGGPAAVPEPASLGLWGLATLIGGWSVRRLRRRSATSVIA